MHEMLYEKEINWADLPVIWKNGTFYNNVEKEFSTPKSFNEKREFLEDLMKGIKRRIL
jgi:hypothetical protein